MVVSPSDLLNVTLRYNTLLTTQDNIINYFCNVFYLNCHIYFYFLLFTVVFSVTPCSLFNQPNINTIINSQLGKIETGELSVNTFVGVRLAADLASACANTVRLYGADVLVAEGILLELLQYEMRQAGLNLTHSQDKDYVRVRK